MRSGRAEAGLSDPSARLREVRSLPPTGEARVALLAALGDPAPEVKKAALDGLGRVARREDIPDLQARMLDSDFNFAVEIARLVKTLADGRGSRIAAAALREARSDRRLAGAAALTVLADPSVEPALRRALADPVAGVRRLAIEALAGLGSTPARLEICARLLDDRDAGVRAAAVHACARLLTDPGAILEPFVADPAPEVRCAVATHLARLPAAAGRRLLADSAREVRETAIEHAGANQLTELTAVLRQDALSDLRLAAARRLGDLGRSASAGGLASALADPQPLVRVAALHALEQTLQRVELVRLLEARLAVGTRVSRRAALYALVRLDATEAAGSMAALTNDPDRGLRIALAHAARELFGSEARILARLRADDDPAVRHAAEGPSS
jgi:HEAT repeat protein